VEDLAKIEFLTAEEFAAKIKVPVAWVRQQTKPSVTSDPAPTVSFGKHRRYAWGSRKMTAWVLRRFS